MKRLTASKTIIGIMFVVVAWGISWPIYKVALEYSPPLLFSGFRALLGGLLFALFLLPEWRKLQWRQTWPIYVISALFNVAIFTGMQSMGLQYLPAGLFSVIVYLQPLLVALFAALWLKESLTIIKVIGILIGFLGVVFISLEGMSGEILLIGIVMALISGTGWAIGTVYVKKTSGMVHASWMIAMQNLLGGSFLTVFGLTVENVTAIDWNMAFLTCLLYGSIIGVTVAFLVYFKLINAGEASKVSSFTFLVPLIAVLIGTLLLREPVTFPILIGMVLILFGIYLINRKDHLKMTRRQTKKTDQTYAGSAH